MPSLDPTYWGFFVFGILAGLCPCNSMLCLALIGYVTGDSATQRPVQDTLELTLPFGIGTMLVITPLGGIFAYLGKSIVLFNASLAYALGGTVMIIMALGLFGIYYLPVKSIFKRLRLPASLTPMGTFLLGLSFGAITVGRVAPMLFAVLAVAALSGSVIYGLSISFIFSAGMMLPLVVISSIGGASGKAIRGRLKEGGIWLDRLLGAILMFAAGYYFYLAFR
ncbi:Cytochrome C biogenesis protein transmembrane region [uncultured archaeon]|nr:Cytochrome C biogenesis protein transmembrane region [uncultured archaeon]